MKNKVIIVILAVALTMGILNGCGKKEAVDTVVSTEKIQPTENMEKVDADEETLDDTETALEDATEEALAESGTETESESETEKQSVVVVREQSEEWENADLSYEDFNIENATRIFTGENSNFYDYYNKGNREPFRLYLNAPEESHANTDWKTVRGIGLGSTLQEVADAYGENYYYVPRGYQGLDIEGHTQQCMLLYGMDYEDYEIRYEFIFDQNDEVMVLYIYGYDY